MKPCNPVCRECWAGSSCPGLDNLQHSCPLQPEVDLKVRQMGYQLWTSPATGYRRRGTRVDEFLNMLDGCFVIRTILEPLQSCMADGQARDAKFILKERGFDVAGVQESENGPVLGFVFREELGHGGVRDHLKPLNASDLISDGSSFADLFSFLRIKERSFILVGSSVGGIVTRADLNK